MFMKKKKRKKKPSTGKRRWIRFFLYCFLAGFLALALYLSFLYYQVSKQAALRIERGAIRNIIFSESPVYYADGKHILGVFFEKTHRQYIQYKDIPPIFIKALVAAEDRNFFNNYGFEIKAIFRAFLANLRAHKVIEGGSTITQQLAKNIFKREKRSYKAKLKELIQALLLERRYTKQEILEMYVNQFFVTGFGSGLQVAAHYFFDKDARELNLVESAFIAGSVKGPYLYNPFIKKTQAGKERAMQLAKERKNYVLGAMLKLHFITKAQYEAAKAEQVPFKEGKVTYRLNVVLDYIRDQLETPYFREILSEQGVDNIATSGIKIYTSINREIQEGALDSLRTHLSLMDVTLSGYDRKALQKRYTALAEGTLKRSETGMPFLCRITHIQRDPQNPYIMVAWDTGGGIIDFEGFKAMGEAWLKGQIGPWAVFDKGRAVSFLNNFHVGDLVPVQMTEKADQKGETRLALSRLPQLEGGIIVLKDGMVRAMVGGFSDRFFNRAVDAKRQVGSIFKPIVYTAALQLKWNDLDALIDRRDLFHFEDTSYIPKPDHEPPATKVSMAWAGVKSENLASVWLLYHLLDRLNMGEFKKVVELLGLNRGKNETYPDYVSRIRDHDGVLVDQDALMEAAFEEARKESEADLIFDGYGQILDYFQRLHFSVDPTVLDTKKPEERQLLQLSFQRLQFMNFEMKRELQQIQEASALDKQGANLEPGSGIGLELAHFHLSMETGGAGPRIIYADPQDLPPQSSFAPITPEWLKKNPKGLVPGDIWIDDLLPSKVIDMVQRRMKKDYEGMLGYQKYDPEVLYHIRDFRTLVSLHYVTRLARIMGISTQLDPVLSFPLGSNAISILEAALAYQTMMTGNRFLFLNGNDPGMVPVIKKIVARDGTVLWQYTPKKEKVLNRDISGQIAEILRMVMAAGTGRRANGAVRFVLDVDNQEVRVPIPVFGKTGTSNQFTTSSFVGLVPGEKEGKGLEVQKGYIIAAYVGYDDNRPMKGKHTAIYGSSGALPLWIDTANAVVNSSSYKKELEVADLAFDTDWTGLGEATGFHAVPISPVSGLPVEPPQANGPAHTLDFHAFVNQGTDQIKLKRLFEPIQGDHHVESSSN